MTPTQSHEFDITTLLGQTYDSTTNEEDIFYCFRLLLGRNPSTDEWKWHSYRNHSDLTTTVKSYLASVEFQKRSMLSSNTGVQDVKIGNINGAKIYVHSNDPIIGRSVLAGNYEPEVVQTFMACVKPGMTVVDIGANIGFYTMLSATLVGSTGRVLAVEPNTENVRLLEASRRLNKLNNVAVAGVAAGSALGVLALHAGESNGTVIEPTDEDEVLQSTAIVPCVNLDALLIKLSNVDFVKVDVEGGEFLALSGMRETLTRHHPIIVSEFSPESLPVFSRCTGDEYLSFLIDMGYLLNVVNLGGGGVIECGIDVEKVLRAVHDRQSDHVDLLCRPSANV